MKISLMISANSIEILEVMSEQNYAIFVQKPSSHMATVTYTRCL